MLVSVVCGIITGNINDVSGALFSGTESALELFFTTGMMMCFWGGIMNIAQKSGASKGFSMLLTPLIKVLFPKLDINNDASKCIAMNISANVLGLGNAATPFGLSAMKELQEINDNKDVASEYMITFVVLNSVSIQLIPTTVAALRQKYGATDPMDITFAVIIVSLLSLLIAMLSRYILYFFSKTKRGKRI